MFWKLHNFDQYEYHAIVSLKVDTTRQQMALYGQRHFIVTLANGKQVEHTFEAKDWGKFSQSYLHGGFVLNEH